MARLIYPKYLEALISGSSNISLIGGDVKVVLVDTAEYTYSASHQFLSDIPTAARVATSGNLANKSVTNGVFDADDITINGVSGASAEAFVIYIDTGTASTSRLVVFDDVSAGLPYTPSGGNLTFQWSNGANKILSLAGT